MTGTAGSAAAFDAAVFDYYAWRNDPVATLTTAAASDPSFGLAHSAIASLLLLAGVRGDDPNVRSALDAAEASSPFVTHRERRHLAAAQAWSRGEIVTAADIWEDILLDHPRDALALRFAHDTYFYLGASQSIRDSVARVLPHWNRGDAAYGFVLGQYAFGLEEAGELRKAEQVGQTALALNAEDAWATHALAHVLETESRQAEGIELLRQTRPSWSKATALAVHNGWHLALYLIEQGELDKVLADYDSYVAPKIAGDALLDLVDAAALLWRIELAGGHVGDRWKAITQQWLRHVDDHVLVFNDLHIAFCVARNGNPDDVRRLTQSLDRFERDGVGDNHRVTVEIGRRIIDGVLAFAAGDYARAVDRLLPVRYQTSRIGGSHAQRDILAQTIIAAAERAGRAPLARSLLTERLAVRPTTRTHAQLARYGVALAA